MAGIRPGGRKDRTLLLKFSEYTSTKDVFELLSKAGVDPKIHLDAVQQLPRFSFDVKFRQVVFRNQFEQVLQGFDECTVESYSEVTVVTALYIDLDLDNNYVKQMLSQYGEVVGSRLCTFANFPGILNGNRAYQIKLKKHIPSVVRIANRNVWFTYWGQPKTCSKCGSMGHLGKECKNMRCYRCQQ
ncbi:zinc finger CCHC domain-containing protein 3-like, partial [Saccoglossus kowalevskii]|uniref:Zinc finger CCHC domain-containing protein 3-like n=1 Tax=Saccoglossus kowalevskii TaxID=10224 RepID=A0ABM0M191_SACKO